MFKRQAKLGHAQPECHVNDYAFYTNAKKK